MDARFTASVALLGPPGSGKTTFLAAMVMVLKERFMGRQEWHGFEIEPVGEETAEWEREVARPLVDADRLPPADPSGSDTFLLFSLRGMGGQGRVDGVLALRDVSGKDFESGDLKAVSWADVVWLFVGMEEPEGAGYAGCRPEISERRFAERLGRVVRRYREAAVETGGVPNVILVLSRMDEMTVPFFGLRKSLSVEEPADYPFLWLERRSEEVSGTLRQVAPAVIAGGSGIGPEARFVAASALGASPIGGRPIARWRPEDTRGIVSPLMWTWYCLAPGRI